MKNPRYLELLHDDTHKNPQWAQKMIPVLVYWAKSSNDNKAHYYSDLSKAVGHKTDRIGRVLGLIHDIFEELRKEKGFKEVPSLNGLVKSKQSGLPEHGFDYVEPNYNKLSFEGKKEVVQKVNADAQHYEKWDLVLNKLGLKPYKIPDNSSDENVIRKGAFSRNGSEGPRHKELKQFIYDNPESIGIRNVDFKSMEYGLLSGDRLDVYFRLKDKTQIAVEIKSAISDKADILRGIYQCVKYKAILNAEQSVRVEHNKVKTILVLEGEMPEEKMSVALALKIKFFDNFKKG